ncbi:hypothetical protein [Proteiniphilum sp.]|uniref:hypothetical protein n=1 Tax=Proteiniphilum sp. TaxID=1926877 RepID=UPI00333145DA
MKPTITEVEEDLAKLFFDALSLLYSAIDLLEYYAETSENRNDGTRMYWELFEMSENSDFNFKTKARHLKENKNDLEVYFENKLKPIVKELIDNFTFEGLGGKSIAQ